MDFYGSVTKSMEHISCLIQCTDKCDCIIIIESCRNYLISDVVQWSSLWSELWILSNFTKANKSFDLLICNLLICFIELTYLFTYFNIYLT